MGRAVMFPVEQSWCGNNSVEAMFETMAVPPRHELVSSVSGWIFHGEELVLVRPHSGGWTIPGDERRRGETFRETIDRIAWEQAGALLARASLLGGLRQINHPADSAAPDGPQVNYGLWFLAETRDLFPFSEEFEAEDRLLIEPGLVRSIVKPWSSLSDDMLAYAQAVHTMSRFLVEG